MKKLNLYTIVVLSTLAFSACDKELSTPPPNAKVNGTAVIDAKSAQVTLNGVYYRFSNSSNTIADWTGYNIGPAQLTGMIGYQAGDAEPLETNVNIAQNDVRYIPGYWSASYQLLSAANGFIDGLNKLSDAAFVVPARKAEMMAEARFLRAYAHHKLLIFFSEWKDLNSSEGVLLRDELGTVSTAVRKRNTVAESYSSILEDLDYAVANGPTTNPNHYVNKYAAMALQARVLLTRGQPADVTKALSLTNAIIGSGKYTLEASLKNIFYAKGMTSTEVILGIRPQPGQETQREILSNYYRTAGAASYGYAARPLFKNLLASTNDPRAAWMVGETVVFNGARPDGSYFTKFGAFPAALPTQLSEAQYAIRLSEVYLMRAEALARSGGSLADARNDIKLVMSKSGAVTAQNTAGVDAAVTPEEVWKQAYYETLRNLTGEDAIAWQALIRFPLNTITALRPTITSTNQLWFGVPVSEFQVNPLFGAQNDGGYPITSGF